MLVFESSQINWFACPIAAAGSAFARVLARISVRESAIKSAAGYPLPETSAITSPQ